MKKQFVMIAAVLVVIIVVVAVAGVLLLNNGGNGGQTNNPSPTPTAGIADARSIQFTVRDTTGNYTYSTNERMA